MFYFCSLKIHKIMEMEDVYLNIKTGRLTTIPQEECIHFVKKKNTYRPEESCYINGWEVKMFFISHINKYSVISGTVIKSENVGPISIRKILDTICREPFWWNGKSLESVEESLIIWMVSELNEIPLDIETLSGIALFYKLRRISKIDSLPRFYEILISKNNELSRKEFNFLFKTFIEKTTWFLIGSNE